MEGDSSTSCIHFFQDFKELLIMSDQDLLLNGVPIDKLSVKDLRQELKHRGLKAYGLKKAHMIEKLKEDICKEKQIGHGEELHNENVEQSVPDSSELGACVSKHAGEKWGNYLTENEQVVAQTEVGKNVVSENKTCPQNQDKLASDFGSDSRVPIECSTHSTSEQPPEKLDIEGSYTVDSDYDDMSDDAKASPAHATGVGASVADIIGKFSTGREVVSESPKRKRKLRDAWKSSKKKRSRRQSHRNIVPGTQPLKLRSMTTRDAFQPVALPSSKRATNSLRIDYFVHPFTLQQVQDLLAKTGSTTSFWMDGIKTHCYITYSSVEEAIATRNAVYYLKWSEKGESYLEAKFVDPREVNF